VTLALKPDGRSADTFGMRTATALGALVCLVVAGAAACSSAPTPTALSESETTSMVTSPPTTARPRPRIRETTSTASLADTVCAEIEDPSFDTQPLEQRRLIRDLCASERELEAQDELLRESGGLDPPDQPDPPAYEPDYPEPEDEPAYEPDYPDYP
jgi:hypothetical protein